MTICIYRETEMKKLKRRIMIVVLFGLSVGIGCFGAGLPGIARGDEKSIVANTSEELEDEDRWGGDDWGDEARDADEDLDEDYDDDFEDMRELEWELVERKLFGETIQLSTDVARDEVKTVVFAANLLVEHAELPVAIDSLSKAIATSSSPAIKAGPTAQPGGSAPGKRRSGVGDRTRDRAPRW